MNPEQIIATHANTGLIGLFFFSGFQIFLLGLVGEYISVILSHVRKLPLVIEKERINFDDKS